MDEAMERGAAILRRFNELLRGAQGAFAQNRLADAEQLLEEAVELSAMMIQIQARPDTLWSHSVARFQLGLTLFKLSAAPEAIPHLEVAVDMGRQVVSTEPSLEEQFPVMLLQLAKAYRGPVGYAPAGQVPLLDADEMRAHRVDRMRNGAWPIGTMTLMSEEQAAKALDPLNEAIPILRRLVRTDRDQFQSKLALCLNLLGETYLDASRFVEAEPPLREAEAMYRLLVMRDPGFFQPLLTDTLELLGRIPNANPGSLDRISTLEELLPRLREEGHISREEMESGVTLTKSAARDRLSDAVNELYRLYETEGMVEEQAALEDEVNMLLGETYNIRWG
ncbi:tetratricopeptide repeat protein [Demequina sp. NBRC 110057]|uniref:tetratricopeptide repeat protein n=1 Tax=Demequina sp. NBRC 110057 TaxID=1570346 RepID=UPI0009FE97C2|nr:tetratricopeptide repeat protein [Demequina sp. NBRC 110057]